MIDKEIDSVLREIKDFPNKGINFKDITSLLLYPKLGSKILDSLAAKLNSTKLDAIVGVESRGFLFGYSLAMKLQIPFVPARKGGKLPGLVVQTNYSLEYEDGSDVEEKLEEEIMNIIEENDVYYLEDYHDFMIIDTTYKINGELEIEKIN